MKPLTPEMQVVPPLMMKARRKTEAACEAIQEAIAAIEAAQPGSGALVMELGSALLALTEARTCHPKILVAHDHLRMKLEEHGYEPVTDAMLAGGGGPGGR